MTSAVDKNEERRKRVFVGTLPPDFLRITGTINEPLSSEEQQVAADAQAALALQQQLSGGMQYTTPSFTGRLSITVAQAKLVKNYGVTRMDPYVRLRVGHCIYETHTDPNGGKNPRWNKVVQCLLPQGVNSIYLEIFDECSFTMDELIAWTRITIPQNVISGETHEDWYPLNGKQGEGMEGMINLVLSLGPAHKYGGVYGVAAPMAPMTPVMMNIPATTFGVKAVPRPVPMSCLATPIPESIQYPQYHLSAEDLKMVEEMFPNIEKDVVKSVYEANRGNKDATVNSLLQMSD